MHEPLANTLLIPVRSGDIRDLAEPVQDSPDDLPALRRLRSKVVEFIESLVQDSTLLISDDIHGASYLAIHSGK